jgi:hypothetical protein
MLAVMFGLELHRWVWEEADDGVEVETTSSKALKSRHPVFLLVV